MDEMHFQEMAEVLPCEVHRIGEQNTYTIEGRFVHRFLEVGRDYNTWVKDQIERGRFIENTNFIFYPFKGVNSGRGRPRDEYHFTFDAAKKICMMSATVKGNEVRQYFLECERRANASLPVGHEPQTIEEWMLDFSRVVSGEVKLIRTDVNTIRDEVQCYQFRATQVENIAYQASVNAFQVAADLAQYKQEHQPRTNKHKPADRGNNRARQAQAQQLDLFCDGMNTPQNDSDV